MRDFTSNKPRKVLGIVRPSLSPDGSQIAFAAVGDIWVVPSSGGKPVNLTNDSALDTDPAWSPDGASLVYSSDKTSPQLQLWVRDMKSGQAKQVTNLSTQPQGASFSPDGKRIVFFNVDGMWRVAQISVLDLAAGTVTKIHDTLPQPGAPVWSPDGTRVALAGVAPLSTRFREGTNQVLTISTTGGADEWQAPIAMMGVDSRGGGGVAWSPDGTKMAGIYGGLLSIWPVSRERRRARSAAPGHFGAGPFALVAGRFAAHPLSVLRCVEDPRHRDRRVAHGAARLPVDAGDPDQPHRHSRRQADRHDEPDPAHQRGRARRGQPDRRALFRTPTATTRAARSSTPRSRR